MLVETIKAYNAEEHTDLSISCTEGIKKILESGAQVHFQFVDYLGEFPKESNSKSSLLREHTRTMSLPRHTRIWYRVLNGEITAIENQSRNKWWVEYGNIEAGDIPFSDFRESDLIAAAREIQSNTPPDDISAEQAA